MDPNTEARYRQAIDKLKEGKTPQGDTLKVSQLTGEAFQACRIYAGQLSREQGQAAQNLRNRRFRG